MTCLVFCLSLVGGAGAAEAPKGEPPIRLRAWGVPSAFGVGPMEEANRMIMDAFRAKHPGVEPVSATGLILPSATATMDMVPFMQIAGDIAPDAVYVNFRFSQTYIDKRLLYPLDRYIEQIAGVSPPDSGVLANEAYVELLKSGAGWERVADRVPMPSWEVIRRLCPYGLSCPYRREWGQPPEERHRHVWAYPVGPVVMALSYDRSLFAEHAEEGVEERAPRDWEEMLRWAKLVTDPEKNEYGFQVVLEAPAWTFLNFLYSAGGRVVRQDANGDWYCTLDTEEAVEAGYFFARLRHEPVVRDGKVIARGVVRVSESGSTEPVRFGMTFAYLDQRYLTAAGDQTRAVGPVPRGPTAVRGSEFNAQMCGVFSGLKDQPRRRDAAWNYIQFYDGPEARRIRTAKMVEGGLGKYVARRQLERFNEGGRYDSVIRQVSPELERVYEVAFASGVPEPYGRGCSVVY